VGRAAFDAAIAEKPAAQSSSTDPRTFQMPLTRVLVRRKPPESTLQSSVEGSHLTGKAEFDSCY
jgi:hypothetical protein